MRLKIPLFKALFLTIVLAGCASRPSVPAKQGPEDSSPVHPTKDYNFSVYHVKKGETLRSIGRRLDVPWEEILRANGYRPEDLEVGQLLLIPLHAREKTQESPDRSVRIVIDPGHGGRDPGAISPIGLYEKDVNLAVSLETARLLRQYGFMVTMTRQTDIFIELNRRADISNEKQADLFVSIHADSCTDPSVRGYTIYVRRDASRASRRAAGVMDDSLAGNGINSRGVREADYRVLVNTDSPSILIELGYLSNRHEASMLRKRSFQRQLAEGIARGIKSFFHP